MWSWESGDLGQGPHATSSLPNFEQIVPALLILCYALKNEFEKTRDCK